MQFEPSAPDRGATQLGQGLFWQDMQVGAKFRTYTRTITETDLVTFVTLTGMVDSGFLDATLVGPMGGRPVPGALTLSIIEGFIIQSLIRGTGLAMLNYTLEPVAPVHVGDTVHAIVEFTGVRPTAKGDRGIVDSAITIFNQRAEPVMRYSSRRMIAGRPQATEGQ